MSVVCCQTACCGWAASVKTESDGLGEKLHILSCCWDLIFLLPSPVFFLQYVDVWMWSLQYSVPILPILSQGPRQQLNLLLAFRKWGSHSQECPKVPGARPEASRLRDYFKNLLSWGLWNGIFAQIMLQSESCWPCQMLVIVLRSTQKNKSQKKK